MKAYRDYGMRPGTVFGSLMEEIDNIKLPHDQFMSEQTLYALLDNGAKYTIYKSAGAVHGCALCKDGEILTFVEDAEGTVPWMPSPAGWVEGIEGYDKFLHHRPAHLKMVIKTAQMKIPALVSLRTHMGYEVAQRSALS
jgi:FdhD protein